jgi:hypothetical protein
MKLRDYILAAFHARPIGMFVPPNWVGIAAFGLAGLANPGLWLIGAGLELAYLFTLVSNPRFRRFVDGTRLLRDRRAWEARQQALVAGLAPDDRRRFEALSRRCQTILSQQQVTRPGAQSPELAAQGEGLGRLLWIYLRLLLTKQAIQHVLRDSRSSSAPVEDRLAELEDRLAGTQMSPELRKSLEGQAEILRQRQARQAEAVQKLAFLDAELTRIEEQIELIREQAVVSPDAGGMSQRIDHIAATLGGTTQWIQEQQKLYGAVEDLLVEPAPLVPEGGS